MILFKGKNKPTFKNGRNAGNVATIWCYDNIHNTLEKSEDVSRSTSGSYNMSNGREYKDIPTKKAVKHLLPYNIEHAQFWCNTNGGKFNFNQQ